MDASAPACPPAEMLFALAEGGLDSAQQRACEAHVAGCPACEAKLRETRALQRISETLARAQLNRRDRERIARWTENALEQLRRQRKTPQ